jgi:hypothetical protein
MGIDAVRVAPSNAPTCQSASPMPVMAASA